jgi:DNA-binding IscR family transcriptional regulator
LARQNANGAVSTVREIADQNGISYDLLAKIMQELKRDGMIMSHQGVRGKPVFHLFRKPEHFVRPVNRMSD